MSKTFIAIEFDVSQRATHVTGRCKFYDREDQKDAVQQCLFEQQVAYPRAEVGYTEIIVRCYDESDRFVKAWLVRPPTTAELQQRDERANWE